MRWLADSAYWCYLASLPPIVLFQHLAKDWEVASGLKCLFVSAATMVLLLVTYRWCVRYTWIGRILNGPRTAPGAEAPAQPTIRSIPVLSERITG